MGIRGVCLRRQDGEQQEFCEIAIRHTAVGKKNRLFVGEAEPGAGERCAIVYTIQSCRRQGIGPCAYLRDFLTRRPSMSNRQTRAFTPEDWGKIAEEFGAEGSLKGGRKAPRQEFLHGTHTFGLPLPRVNRSLLGFGFRYGAFLCRIKGRFP